MFRELGLLIDATDRLPPADQRMVARTLTPVKRKPAAGPVHRLPLVLLQIGTIGALGS